MHDIFFKSDDVRLAGTMETVLALSVLPCMSVGCDINLNGEVSRRLLDAISKIMDIYCAWHASLYRVGIENVRAVETGDPTKRRVGVFFTGGVDSFFTLLKNRDEITDIIFVHGFDLRLRETSLRAATARMVRDVGAQLGKGVIEVETNLREHLDHYVDWSALGHGPALASIGHLLSPFLKKVFISASYTYAHLEPWGSHVLLDPLWSSNALEFEHYGIETSRTKKVEFISGYDVALQWLRVCSGKSDGTYNCGECAKCLRTMINLHAVGALHRSKTFPSELDLHKINRKLLFLGESEREFVRQNIRVIEQRLPGDGLLKVLQRVLDRPRWKCCVLYGSNEPMEFMKRVSRMLAGRMP